MHASLHHWGVMLDPEFDPEAIADTRPIKFKRSMEGVGTLKSPLSPGYQSPRSRTERPTSVVERRKQLEPVSLVFVMVDEQRRFVLRH